jgi:GTP pyrophosphokinase
MDLDDVFSIELLDKIQTRNVNHVIDLTAVKKAMECAKLYHSHQERQSGEPYYSHSFEVAIKVLDYYFETDPIVAAIIHDVVEDSFFSISQVGLIFNSNVKEIVNKLTKLDLNKKRKLSPEWTLHKLSQDKIATVIKLLDRMHNMQTIFYIKSETKRIRIAKETINIYVPLAQIMGLEDIKNELLSLSYKVLSNLSRSEFES